MKTKFLMSAAAIAVLMAGGVANAQNPNAGSSGGAAGASSGASGGASGGASMGSGGTSAPSVRGGADAGGSGAIESQGSQKGGMSAQEESAPKGHPRSAQENKAGKSPGSHTATDSKGAAKNDNAANGERMNKNTASDSKSGAESRTTGNAATAAKAAPPAGKRTQITSAIKQEKVTAVTNVNFNVSVGARVPASVHFYPVPASVIAIYPEWRGYEFILVGGRYVIVAPETHEIIYILT